MFSFKFNSLQKLVVLVFFGLFYSALLLLLYPHIKVIDAYHGGGSYHEPYVDGPNPQDENAVPPPVVPCMDAQSTEYDKNPEFHSMRPYQASPCGDAPKAYFCNNDYMIIEEVSQRYNPSLCSEAGGTYICQKEPNATLGGEGVFIIGGQDGRDYFITLSKAQYPVVGNTQEVTNSQSNAENIGMITRMNEYVNWYIQGDYDKAEYGSFRPAWPSLAGPAKNLEPQDFLNLRRLELLHEAGVKPEAGVDLIEYEGPPDLVTIDPNTGEATTRQTFAHNQIVVCETGGIPRPCYRGDGSRASGLKRLLPWWEGRGSRHIDTWINTPTFRNWTDTSVWSGLTPPFPWLFTQEIYYIKAYREWRGDVCLIFQGRLMCVHSGSLAGASCNILASSVCSAMGSIVPPLGTVCSIAVPAMTFACNEITNNAVDPIVSNINQICDSMVAIADISPYVTPSNRQLLIDKCRSTMAEVINIIPATSAGRNIYADLYRFIPLGNPSDKNAAHLTTRVGVRAPGQTQAVIVSYEIEKNPVLRYPQTQSSVEGAKFLNQMHTPLQCESDDPTSCEPVGGFGTNYEPRSCTFVDVFTNPGDSLTFNNPPSYLHVDDILTRVDQIECQNQGELDRFHAPAPDGCNGHTWDVCATDKCNPILCGFTCGSLPGMCTSWPECKAEVRIEIGTVPKIPFIDQLWKETVVGSNTSFRKIFPKIEEGAPVSCIKQIPGNSYVSYISGMETNLAQISTAGPNTFPGNGESSVSPGQLYFPHLGTVHEYFLKGIQTAIRPQGFGSPIVNGDPEICALTEGATGECKMWLFMRSSGGQYVYEQIVQAAEATSCNGEHLNPAWALFIALNENAGLMTDDPEGESLDHFGCDQQERAGYALTIEGKLDCMLDTLRNDCAAGKTDEQTLTEYGYPPGYGFGNMGLLGLAGDPPPPLWGSNFPVSTMISTMLSANYSSFSQFADTFCPNSPTLVLPPYQ